VFKSPKTTIELYKLIHVLILMV